MNLVAAAGSPFYEEWGASQKKPSIGILGSISMAKGRKLHVNIRLDPEHRRLLARTSSLYGTTEAEKIRGILTDWFVNNGVKKIR